jgi:hypothetical protein
MIKNSPGSNSIPRTVYRTALFQVIAERVYFRLHASSSAKQLPHLVPIGIPQVSVRQSEFVDFTKSNLQVDLAFGRHVGFFSSTRRLVLAGRNW